MVKIYYFKKLKITLKNQNFHHIDTPLISQNDCEGAGETFTISVHIHIVNLRLQF